MKIDRIENYKDGWFIGAFHPTILQTNDFEVCLKKHTKLERYEKHYHKETTEINLLVRGEMTIQNKLLKAGDIFIIYPYEVSDPVFHTDCEVLVVRLPSIPGDKYIIND